VPIVGNAFLLREMINNLLDNALRYTPAGGRVTARVFGQGDFALLEIEDSGSGISDDDSHKVFDRFYRADGTDGEGSGLGLAIVREIAEVHQAAASLRPKTETRVVSGVRLYCQDRLPGASPAAVSLADPAGTTRTGFA
jgi:two-component system sensor histidine kinase TctE